MTPPAATAILDFWREAGPEKWFAKDDAFDALIRRRFLAEVEAAARGELNAWEETPEGVYALLLLLDQFPRNLYRGSSQAFAADPLALAVAERAIARGFDQAFENPERRFIYMPFMHSEDLADQQRCIALCEAADDPEGVKFAEIHRDIIRDFGRFPHRNPVLGRQSSAEERRFLDDGGFSG
ncbi:DUF924 family protein [Bosea sp. (in: a-proteobacteria)]|jgi:uncharacterized protein (DUF924 family)|uniref:DUF924 family protein n=1 Tax=Bosea sp. (in: a-proteobacteria) TaxID=1871050 RepID=UPI00086B4F3F|nr:DUF924 family protein [Bosea sp. (in: a-proteobacteria)]MBN9436788.1 DUF924 domain-containing protein [Bosea sp. (in: a-proteobacteria)]MBN9447300.1 DUF924 domain-containing protein [Bosea sp. (in: a-proteobacteria)]ODT51056.1 MAG: hypothetical protein ABS59_10140 [Methylobacterium sp. SCN 67-24]